MRSLRTLAACLAALFAVAACGSDDDNNASENGSGSNTTAQSGPPIKIGGIYDLTGGLSALGVPESKGAQAYINKLNDSGGINGRKVELIVMNGESTTDAAISGARELIRQGVVAILGPPSGATARGMQPIVDAAKIPTLSHQGALDLGAGYMFTNTLAGTRTTRNFGLYLASQGVKRVGTLASTDATGQAQAQLASTLFKEAGLEIVSQQAINPTGTDYTTQLAALKNANVDAVMVFASGAPIVTATKGFKALNMQGFILLLNASAAQLPAFGDAGAVARVPEPKVAVHEQVPASDPLKPVIDEFIKVAGAAGVPIDLFGAMGYDGARIVTDTIKAVGPDPARIFEHWINGFRDEKNMAGSIHWTKDDHGCCGLNAWVATTVDPATTKFKVLGPWDTKAK